MYALHTLRLDLVPLSSKQLCLYLTQPNRLESELGLPISRSIVDDRVRQAIGKKLDKMENVEGARLLWFTYWLLIIRNRPFGAGLAGFKGFPDETGEVEIGYGIDVACQGQGYMTEAVKRMIGWAFEEKRCLSIVARGVEKSNIASQRVLAKVGMTIYEESEATLSYRIKREEAGEL